MEREEMPVDVVFVGGGPANLAASIHLMNLIEAHNAAIESGEKSGGTAGGAFYRPHREGL